jgi:hypothetical protein
VPQRIKLFVEPHRAEADLRVTANALHILDERDSLGLDRDGDIGRGAVI